MTVNLTHHMRGEEQGVMRQLRIHTYNTGLSWGLTPASCSVHPH